MFNYFIKKRLDVVERELKAYEKNIKDDGGNNSWLNPGAVLRYRLERLERDNERRNAENMKLKAIVAELCDYVYREEK